MKERCLGDEAQGIGGKGSVQKSESWLLRVKRWLLVCRTKIARRTCKVILLISYCLFISFLWKMLIYPNHPWSLRNIMYRHNYIASNKFCIILSRKFVYWGHKMTFLFWIWRKFGYYDRFLTSSYTHHASTNICVVWVQRNKGFSPVENIF